MRQCLKRFLATIGLLVSVVCSAIEPTTVRHAGLPVQMLAPGFIVRELPVHLTNINCVTYGPDGLLYALGYDGRIHVLHDSKGDGLEDTAALWWDKPTLRTPVAMVWRPDGLYVVSNGKISVLRDTKHSGKADVEEVVVSGWAKDDGHTGGNVDAVGIAFDAENNLYFGVGCADYSNPYRVKDGRSHYDLRSDRGSIQKVSPDRKRREAICSGVRFTYGMAFNRAGDLFCTDQEGETWCPGGNPLDKLEHIQTGRHYAFPPRDAKHLPDVFDEPAVVAFGPQHQSTCGLVFDETNGDGNQKRFGPALWEGDAIVAGFSRGKLWRARLAKTPTGYLGRETLFAALNMLTLSPAIAPNGDLVVACHGGLPDWGTGPAGAGKLFKISYVDQKAPQPVMAWAASAIEVRIAFDRPIPEKWIDASKIRIAFGDPVRAADRFESFRPGYAAVEREQRAYRGQLRVIGATLSADRRTLHIATDVHPLQTSYAISLPLDQPAAADGQEATIELAYDLSGVEAEWIADSQTAPAWTGWLPHPDLDVARAFTAGSQEHEQLWNLLKTPGNLHLRTSIRQATAVVSIRADSKVPLELKSVGNGTMTRATGQSVTVKSRPSTQPVELALSVPSGGDGMSLHVSEHTDQDPTERPLPLAWQYPAWVPRKLPEPPPAGPAPELAGGDWKRGESLFYGIEANCAACHTVREKGGHIGPDLSNLVQRDTAAVLRDIVDPNATINPDHVGYIVSLKDRRVLTGLVRAEGEDKFRILEGPDKETVVLRTEIERMHASPISIMPEGYAKLGPDKLKDLLVFLTTTQIVASPIGAPPARTQAEIDAVMKAGVTPAVGQKLRDLNIVLVAGPKDHGPGEHDYPAWQKEWATLLAKAPHVKVSTVFGRPEHAVWQKADVMVIYLWGPAFWDDESYKELDPFLAHGGGVVALHSTVISQDHPEKLADRLGIAWEPAPKAKFRHGPLDLTFTAPENPITQGYRKTHFVDEDYWPIHAKAKGAEVLATTPDDGGEWPMLWTYQPGKGRVFCTVLGHYSWTFEDPLARILMLRGIAWTAGEPVDRLTDLAIDPR